MELPAISFVPYSSTPQRPFARSSLGLFPDSSRVGAGRWSPASVTNTTLEVCGDVCLALESVPHFQAIDGTIDIVLFGYWISSTVTCSVHWKRSVPPTTTDSWYFLVVSRSLIPLPITC